jgi:hypothetical protein
MFKVPPALMVITVFAATALAFTVEPLAIVVCPLTSENIAVKARSTSSKT